jgi:hypothetical protein
VAPPPERPWEWAIPRTLCADHRRGLRLLDGEPVGEALARVKPVDHTPAGGALGWMLNPVLVEVEGGFRRGWAEYGAAGADAFEDIFTAADCFEASACVDPAAVNILYGLHCAAEKDHGEPAGQDPAVSLRYFLAGSETVRWRKGTRTLERGLRVLSWSWSVARRLEQVRADHGRARPRSADEMLTWVARCVEPWLAPKPSEDPYYPGLVGLAARRFTRLKQ